MKMQICSEFRAQYCAGTIKRRIERLIEIILKAALLVYCCVLINSHSSSRRPIKDLISSSEVVLTIAILEGRCLFRNSTISLFCLINLTPLMARYMSSLLKSRCVTMRNRFFQSRHDLTCSNSSCLYYSIPEKNNLFGEMKNITPC